MLERTNPYRSKSEEILVSETKLLETHVDEKSAENNVSKKKSVGKKLRKTDKEKAIEYGKQQKIKNLMQKMPVTKTTKCGFWIFSGKFFQRFATQTSYVCIAGIVGCIFNTTFSYFNGTLSTLEKRFKIPSRNSGIIYAAYDTSTLLIAGVLCYYAGNGHRPRWIGFGLCTIIIFCLLMALPHFIYGPGENALALTAEFGVKLNANESKQLVELEETKSLCRAKSTAECIEEEGSLTPQIIFYAATFIAGIGGSLFDSLGSAYMDDNTEKAKAPMMLSICYFLRMFGPALGYVMASMSLKLYISPNLQPTITADDPRWLGAWWLGWLLVAGLLIFFGFFLSLFPKHLPLAVARRIVEKEQKREHTKAMEQKRMLETIEEEEEQVTLNMLENIEEKIAAAEIFNSRPSLKDMIKTFKELWKNKTFMYNNWSSLFYCLGYQPFWLYTAKYIEIQYRQSASTASMVTGTAGFAFSAVGVLSSGYVISHYKPTARQMAAWNVLVTYLTVCGIVSYAFIGCDVNDNSMVVNVAESNTTTCNSACDCGYVQYSPVCGEDGKTYISPCHAGCRRKITDDDDKETFYECACIERTFESSNLTDWASLTMNNVSTETGILSEHTFGGKAINGPCPVDCIFQFAVFIIIMCFLKFFGATSQASSFLLNMRCVPEKDKTTSISFGMMMLCLLVFVPGPILFGWLFDCLCLVWGKTCTSEGNCWLYDAKLLRYVLSSTSGALLAIGSIFDVGVWMQVRDLKIFDEEVTPMEMEVIKHEGNLLVHKKRNSF